MKTSANTKPEYLEGVIIGGGCAHDELDNSCATVHIAVNLHHLTLTDDSVHGWTLEKFDSAAQPEAGFLKVFGAPFGDAAEFDHDTLSDFRKTLERVGIDRIAEIEGGKAIALRIYQSSPRKK